MDVGIYVEFYSDEKISEIAKDKIVINYKLVFPKEIVVGAKSLDEFYNYEKEIKKIHKDVIVRYWPILEKEEGYWISFKAKTGALERVFNEVKNRKNKTKFYLMIDFEDPIQKVEDVDIEKNKKLVEDILENKRNYKLDISVVENVPLFFKKSGIDVKDVEGVKMFYSSLRENYHFIFKDFISKFLLEREIKRGLKEDKNYVIALGCLDKGILGDEPLISEKRLKYDLGLVKKHGMKKVMLFGYQNKYKEVLKDFMFS